MPGGLRSGAHDQVLARGGRPVPQECTQFFDSCARGSTGAAYRTPNQALVSGLIQWYRI
jgi:hypothetical protein